MNKEKLSISSVSVEDNHDLMYNKNYVVEAILISEADNYVITCNFDYISERVDESFTHSFGTHESYDTKHIVDLIDWKVESFIDDEALSKEASDFFQDPENKQHIEGNIIGLIENELND